MENNNSYRAEIDIVADLSTIDVDESIKEALADNKHLINLLFLQRFSNFIKRTFLYSECLLPNNQEINLATGETEIDDNIRGYLKILNAVSLISKSLLLMIRRLLISLIHY